MGLVFIVTILWAPTGIMGMISRLRATGTTARSEPA
jgi:hypothetical protein